MCIEQRFAATHVVDDVRPAVVQSVPAWPTRSLEPPPQFLSDGNGWTAAGHVGERLAGSLYSPAPQR